MSVLVWPPHLRPSDAAFYLVANAARLESPLSRASQVIVRQGERWVCRMSFNRRAPDIAAQLDAFIAELGGPACEVRLFDFRRSEPRGATFGELTFGALSFGTLRFFGYPATGRPVTAGAQAAGATSVTTSGWPNSVTVLRLGDYVQIGDTLHMIVRADVVSSGTGTATLNVRPALRRAVAANVELMLIQPTARFRLADAERGDNPTDAGRFSSYLLSFVEALP